MGGSPNGENNDASDPIVLNMYQTNTINTSKTYALSMLKYMEPVIPLKFTTVQGAPFRVLKLPEIPSLLVETAYISNKKEEKLLRSSRHQTKIAAAMANAVVEILPADLDRKAEPAIILTREALKLKDPIYGGQKLKIAVQDKGNQDRSAVSTSRKSPVKAKKKSDSDGLHEEPTVYVYRVKEGDTLEKIALKHDTTLGALLKINGMKLKDPLYAGHTVKIKDKPVQKETRTVVKKGVSKQTKKEKFTYYKVKKGETLDIIARRNGITISELRQLNRMKRSDPLLADRKLKLP
jgi:N-acetylmuramoyl-L-alanine amidase